MVLRKYEFTFTDNEIMQVTECVSRILEAVKVNNQQDNFGKTTWDQRKDGHYTQVFSEFAVAKFFDIEYQFDSTFDPNRSDLINGIEVRATKYSNGHLIVHKRDKPAPFVFCTVDLDTCTTLICGWRDLVDCVLDKYWRTDMPAPAYFVPQSDLYDMATLKERFAA